MRGMSKIQSNFPSANMVNVGGTTSITKRRNESIDIISHSSRTNREFELNQLQFGGVEIKEGETVKRFYNHKKMLYKNGQTACYLKTKNTFFCDNANSFLIYNASNEIIGILQRTDSIWIACMKSVDMRDVTINIKYENESSCQFFFRKQLIGKYKTTRQNWIFGKDRKLLKTAKNIDPYILIFLKLLIDELPKQ